MYSISNVAHLFLVPGDHVILYDVLHDPTGKQYAAGCVTTVKSATSTFIYKKGYVGCAEYSV